MSFVMQKSSMRARGAVALVVGLQVAAGVLQVAAGALQGDDGALPAALHPSPNHLHTQECGYAAEEEWNNLLVESMCGEPRDVYVPLTLEHRHLQLAPSAVWVKRCMGVCLQSGKSCEPTATRVKQIPVRYVELSSGKERCGTYAVEEHVDCGCGCPHSARPQRPQRPRDCREPALFDADRCLCVCPNLDERRSCFEKRHMGRKWNQENCSCEVTNT